jgi:hypothetical protein
MNQNPEIIEVNPPESEMDQPKAASITKTPLLKPISLIASIRKWNPTGIRVVVNLPLVGNDRNYLFLIRCSPFIPHLANDTIWLHNAGMANQLSVDNDLIIHDYDYKNFPKPDGTVKPMPQFDTDPGIYIYHHSLPPLISEMARANRFWTGGLKFRLRSKAAFTHNAVLFGSPIYGVKQIPVVMPCTNYQAIVPYRQKWSYGSSQANSYMYNDLTMTRHMEIQYSYQKPYSYVDQFGIIAQSIGNFKNSINADGTNITQGYLDGLGSSRYDDFIGIGLRGTIDNSSSGDNQIMFEIDIAAGDDFQFSGETAYANPVSDDALATRDLAILGINRSGNRITKTSPITPRVYSNPDYDSPGTMRYVQNIIGAVADPRFGGLRANVDFNNP